MSETLKIVIPMAGWGTRMRPHTWSKPKPLVGVAGRTALDYLLDMFKTVPDPGRTEYIFIVDPYLGEMQIPDFIAKHYPEIKSHFVVQGEMKGQSHALYLARQYLTGSMIMCFSDTLLETDFSFLDREQERWRDVGQRGRGPAPIWRCRSQQRGMGDAADREAANKG